MFQGILPLERADRTGGFPNTGLTSYNAGFIPVL